MIPEPSPINIPANDSALTVPVLILPAVKLVIPETIPSPTLTDPSKTIIEPAAGVKFIPPVEVLIVTAASPGVKSSDLIEFAETPVIPEPSPINIPANDSALTVPAALIFLRP